MAYPNVLNLIYKLFKKFPRFIKVVVVYSINLILRVRLHFIKTPNFIIFFVTNRCNANCSHCFYRSNLNTDTKELGLENIKKIAHSLKNKNFLLITGGEAFLRDDLVEICESFYRFGKTKRIRIASNGYLTDRIISFSEEVLQYNIELTIQISLDAIGDKHDKIRKLNGLFVKAANTIAQLKMLKKRFPKLKISVTATITKSNCDEIEALFRYVKEKFDLVLELTLVRETASGIYNLDKKFQSDLSVLEESSKLPNQAILEGLLSKYYNLRKISGDDFITAFSELEKKIETDIIFKAKKPPFKCVAGRTDVVIYSNGEVSLCEITKPFGMLENYDYNLFKLWNSKEARYARENIKNCYCMHPCHLVSSMKQNVDFLLFIRGRASVAL